MKEIFGPEESVKSPENIEKNNFGEATKIIQDSLEISEIIDTENGIQEAICMIKPDAFDSRDFIVKKLEESGLYVVKRKATKLTEDFMDKNIITDKFPKSITEAQKKHYLSDNSEIILLKGEDVVRKLLKVIGLNTDPGLCDEDTIRSRFGMHIPVLLDEDLKYFFNAIHRPKDEQERKSDLNKFKPLL